MNQAVEKSHTTQKQNPLIRGIKVYLPVTNRISEFRSFVALAHEYRYNTLMIEVGGAMEYRRHPEINDGWVEYCAFMNEYPGKAREFLSTFDKTGSRYFFRLFFVGGID